MADALNILDRGKPYILAQSAVPVCLAPNGTVAVNGIVTLGTALPTTYSGGIWLRLPASAVVDGLAGLYWAVMSSTTQGQVYTTFVDPATQFIPYIPSGLVAAVGSNATYTQTTAADITLVNVTVPGGAMGANGVLQTWEHCTNTTTNTKIFKQILGAVTTLTLTQVGNSNLNTISNVRNRGTLSRQVIYLSASNAQIGASTTASTYVSADTAIDNTFALTCNLAVATDFGVIEGFSVQVLPS